MTVLDGDILRISTNFELGDGSQYQNIYHVIRDGTDPIADSVHISNIRIRLDVAYATIDDLVEDTITPQLSFVDRVEFNEIVDEWRVVENIGTFTLEFAPTGVDETLPYQSSPYVIFKTDRPKSVGKKFLFPLMENQQSDTVLIGGAVTAIAAYGAAILAGIELGGDGTLTFGIVRTGIQTYLNFLVAVVPDVLGSQKRRRPGVGA